MTSHDNAATADGVGETDTIGRPASDERRPECRHWIGPKRRHCKEVDGVRHYLPGMRCPAHTPNALQGKPEVPTGPGWPVHREEATA